LVARGAEAATAGQQALGAVAGIVRREACLMAYGDCFGLIGALLLAMVLAVRLYRGAKGGALAAHQMEKRACFVIPNRTPPVHTLRRWTSQCH
jgi:hypothetical protein